MVFSGLERIGIRSANDWIAIKATPFIHSGNPSHEPLGLGPYDANPAVKLLPKAKATPLDTSGPPRRTPRARVEPFSPSLVSQNAQYVASATEESEAAPSPTSAGASHSQVDPLGKCNFNNPPHPIIFDAKAHEINQISQLETYVLTRYGVSSWRVVSAVVPICPSGHVLDHIQITGFANMLQPSTTCCCCTSSIGINSHAFTCFRCVAAYFCQLPVDKVIVSAGLSKGALYCTNCAYRTEIVDQARVQYASAPSRN